MKIMAIAATTAVAGMTAWAEQKVTARAERNVTVYMNNDLNMVAVYQARERAAKMFAEVGVRIDWRIGRHSGAQPEREPEIVVSFVQDTPHNYPPGRLAYAKIHRGRITVFWDRIEQQSGAPAVVVLAHVLVHEITHILQGIERHSESGIMKSRWTLADFRAMASKPLPFTPLDVELVQRGVARRLAQER